MSSRHFNRPSRSSRKQNRSGRGLRFEGLECRTMMSATPVPATVSAAPIAEQATAMASTSIVVAPAEFHGLSSSEQTQLRNLAAKGETRYEQAAQAPLATVDKAGNLVIHGCKGNDFVNVTGGSGGVVLLSHSVDGRWIEYGKELKGVKNIILLAYRGNNEFHNNSTLPSQALGGNGRDFFQGSRAKASDTFFGLAGNDKLDGISGNDHLFGGTGCDELFAGPNNNGEQSCTNVVRGGDNNDYLWGSAGLDKMFGDDGNDILRDDLPGGGNCILRGGIGNDVLYGLDYNAPNKVALTMHGDAGNDRLIVKPATKSAQEWRRDDYSDDGIFQKNAPSKSILEKTLVALLTWKKDV